jgi:IS5 family transposase
MLSKTAGHSLQRGFYSTFEEQLSHRHPLYILADKVQWDVFEKAFGQHYSDEGRPAKPIRLMVSLLLLKHIRNLSDESVVEQWMENVYYQYFSGEKMYACGVPCEASELVHFRNRIGEEGIELIFKESIRINGKDGKEDEATVDTTVQEKNITYPTDNKLHRKIIKKCVAMADTQQIELRQSYSRTVKKLAQQQRFRNHPRNHKRARKADRKIKTIAGRLVRELERKLPAGLHAEDLMLFKKVLAQKRNDTGKVYSLHEPHVQCISKGKEHKKYEFGSKVSIITTKKSGVIIGALNIAKNDYDAHTVDPAFEQQQRLTGITLKRAFMDRGYKGIKEIRGTKIEIPKPFNKQLSNYQQQQLKNGFKRRAAIEPKIGHLKEDHRLSRNFYKGIKGDTINVMLAAAAMNFKRMMNIWKEMFLALIYRLLEILIQACLKPNLIPINQK